MRLLRDIVHHVFVIGVGVLLLAIAENTLGSPIDSLDVVYRHVLEIACGWVENLNNLISIE